MFKKRTMMQAQATTPGESWRQILLRVGGAGDDFDARRTNARFPIDGDVKVAFIRDGDQHHRMLKMINISVQGITAKGNNEIPEGTRLEVELEFDGITLQTDGEVVHCTDTLGGFKIGIRLDLREDEGR